MERKREVWALGPKFNRMDMRTMGGKGKRNNSLGARSRGTPANTHKKKKQQQQQFPKTCQQAMKKKEEA